MGNKLVRSIVFHVSNFPTMPPTLAVAAGMEFSNGFVRALNAVFGTSVSQPFRHVDPVLTPRGTGAGQVR